MIISASRRTDIPCFYSQWFYNRLRAGSVCAANPFNAHQISRISLNPQVVDAFVFWTKNPEPMLPRLEELDGYEYYFQFTLNGYGAPVEPGLADVKRLADTFLRLSDRAGKDRVLWRYDPILISDTYSLAYHEEMFGRLAEGLKGATNRCTISFLDEYAAIKKNLKGLHLTLDPNPGPEQAAGAERIQKEAARRLANAAAGTGIELVTCAETVDLSEYGIGHGSCIDREWLERLLGCALKAEPDKNQRPACGCISSIDIGAYGTCKNGCLYCYATNGRGAVGAYDPESEILCRGLGDEDRISDRKMKTLK